MHTVIRNVSTQSTVIRHQKGWSQFSPSPLLKAMSGHLHILPTVPGGSFISRSVRVPGQPGR